MLGQIQTAERAESGKRENAAAMRSLRAGVAVFSSDIYVAFHRAYVVFTKAMHAMKRQVELAVGWRAAASIRRNSILQQQVPTPALHLLYS